MTPLVSVCMSVKNGEPWLAEAVESILNQSFADLELLVIDDASTDSTPEILSNYATSDARVVVMRQDESRGLGYALNRICGEARGRYIARMDGDDVATPTRLARQVEALESDPHLGVVGGAYIVLGDDGVSGRTVRLPTADAAIRRSLDYFNPIVHAAATFRRDAFERLGGFRLHRLCEDYDLWLRFSEQCRIANLDEVVIERREHGGQLSHMRLEDQVTAMLVVVAAARCRRAGESDPLDGRPDPDWHELYQRLGLSERARRRALLNAYAARIVAVGDQGLLDRAQVTLSRRELAELRVAIALRRAFERPGARALVPAATLLFRAPVTVLSQASRAWRFRR